MPLLTALGVPLVWWLGRRLLGAEQGLLGAALFARFARAPPLVEGGPRIAKALAHQDSGDPGKRDHDEARGTRDESASATHDAKLHAGPPRAPAARA